MKTVLCGMCAALWFTWTGSLPFDGPQRESTPGDAVTADDSVAPAGGPEVVIRLNEVLADPPPEEAGDANQDGVRHAQEDEFVEIINCGTLPLDIAGWSLRDSVGLRHVFPDSVPLIIEPGSLATVFGGGTPTGFTGWVFTASTGRLSLNNDGDLAALLDTEGEVIDSHTYGREGGRDRSMVRLPDGWGGWYLAGDGGSLAPHSAHRYNEGTTLREVATWGAVKSGLARP